MSKRTVAHTGTFLALAGTGLAFWATFQPLTSVTEFGDLVKNSLSSRQDIYWIYAMLGAAVFGAVRFELLPTRNSAKIVIGAGLGLVAFVALYTTLYDVYQVATPGPGHRSFVAMDQVSNWGSGPFAGIAGGLMVLLGGLLQYRANDPSKSEWEKARRKAKEHAPLPVALVALPRRLWNLLYAGAVVLALVPIFVVMFAMPRHPSTLEVTAVMAVFYGYAIGMLKLIRQWMKEDLVPNDAPNAPPKIPDQPSDQVVD